MRVLIADDHRIVREGLALMVADADDVELVGEAEDGQALIDLLASVEADVVLLDVRMPRAGGLDILPRVRDLAPNLKVIMLSMHDEPAYVSRAIELGANAYLLKNTSREELLDALRVVHSGGSYIQSELAGTLVDLLAGNGLELEGPRMSPRVTQVLRLLALGYENKQIATELGISDATVKTYIRTLYDELDVRNRAEAVAVAMRLGLIE